MPTGAAVMYPTVLSLLYFGGLLGYWTLCIVLCFKRNTVFRSLYMFTSSGDRVGVGGGGAHSH
jgi:hypothetical protein